MFSNFKIFFYMVYRFFVETLKKTKFMHIFFYLEWQRLKRLNLRIQKFFLAFQNLMKIIEFNLFEKLKIFYIFGYIIRKGLKIFFSVFFVQILIWFFIWSFVFINLFLSPNLGLLMLLIVYFYIYRKLYLLCRFFFPRFFFFYIFCLLMFYFELDLFIIAFLVFFFF